MAKKKTTKKKKVVKSYIDDNGFINPKSSESFMEMMDDYESKPIRLKGGKKVYR